MSIPGIVLLVAAAVFIYLFNGLVIKRSRVENFTLYYTAFLKRRLEYLDELLRLHDGAPEALRLQLQHLLDNPRLTGEITDKSQWDNAVTDAWKELFEVIKDEPDLQKLLAKIERNGGHLATARIEYNQAVQNLNCEIAVFPWSVLAKFMHLTARTPCVIPQSEWYKPLPLRDCERN